MNSSLTFVFAFVAVLALIGVAAWLVRRFAGNRLGASTKSGRMPRLAVIDAAAVDGRRRLVLVRRDNVEHLLMIGGPTDIVVEPNIVRAAPARAGAEPPRIPPLPESLGWSDGPARPEALDPPEPALPEPRPNRPSFMEDNRRPALPPLPERRAPEPAPFPPPEAMTRVEPRPEPARPRSEPMIPRSARLGDGAARPPAARAPDRIVPTPPAAPPPAAASQSADQNLAEMAQKLEAALRRPGSSETNAPPVAPEAPAVRAPRPPETPRSDAPPISPPTKSGFENLEDEMASLLGRPKTPT